MWNFKIPLVHKNPCFETISQLTVEVAVIIQHSLTKMRISWESIRVELPYCTSTGEKSLVIEIPDGECAIPPGYSVYTFIKHVVDTPAEIEQSETFSPSKNFFNYFNGILQLNYDKVPLLLKWRFTVAQKDGLSVSPWSHCYKGKPENLRRVPLPAISTNPLQDLYLYNQCPDKELTLGANMDFIFGVINKSDRDWENVLIRNTLKPLAGVELQVISAEEVYATCPINTLITSENIGVFTCLFRKIPSRKEFIRHIILKLKKAPAGASLVENITSLFVNNREVFCERCITSIKITPLPDKSETQIKILDSISYAEVGAAEILRLEAEKIKKAIAMATDIKGIISVGDSVQATIKELIKYQILLELKLEDTIKMIKE